MFTIKMKDIKEIAYVSFLKIMFQQLFVINFSRFSRERVQSDSKTNSGAYFRSEAQKPRTAGLAALFSRLCKPAVSLAGCFTSLLSFFPIAETRSWHQEVVITRGVHFSASPDRRVGPSTAVGRGSCVLQIKLSWKQTGSGWTRPNKLTPPRCTYSARTTVSCFPTRGC